MIKATNTVNKLYVWIFVSVRILVFWNFIYFFRTDKACEYLFGTNLVCRVKGADKYRSFLLQKRNSFTLQERQLARHERRISTYKISIHLKSLFICVVLVYVVSSTITNLPTSYSSILENNLSKL